MKQLSEQYLTSKEAANLLRIHQFAVQKLFQSGTLPAEKVANRWLVRRSVVERFAATYEGKPGRPRGQEPKRERIR